MEKEKNILEKKKYRFMHDIHIKIFLKIKKKKNKYEKNYAKIFFKDEKEKMKNMKGTATAVKRKVILIF